MILFLAFLGDRNGASDVLSRILVSAAGGHIGHLAKPMTGILAHGPTIPHPNCLFIPTWVSRRLH